MKNYKNKRRLNHTIGYGVAKQIPELFPSEPYANFAYP